MKIIFLDIDGVLNSQYSMAKNFDQGKRPIHTTFPYIDHVSCLNEITDKTGAKIVISSTWRKLHNLRSLQDILYLCHVKADVISLTPVIHNKKRGDEIQKWLDDTEETIESFVILDDDSDMVHLMHRLVNVDNSIGLTLGDVVKAVTMLNDN